MTRTKPSTSSHRALARTKACATSTDAPTDSALQAAQHQWVRLVGAISAMLQMAELLGELPAGVKQHVLLPLRAATERKSVRRSGPDAAAAPAQTPASNLPPQP